MWEPTVKYRWWLLPCFFAKIINYPDRQEIGLLKDASGS